MPIISLGLFMLKNVSIFKNIKQFLFEEWGLDLLFIKNSDSHLEIKNPTVKILFESNMFRKNISKILDFKMQNLNSKNACVFNYRWEMTSLPFHAFPLFTKNKFEGFVLAIGCINEAVNFKKLEEVLNYLNSHKNLPPLQKLTLKEEEQIKKILSLLKIELELNAEASSIVKNANLENKIIGDSEISQNLKKTLNMIKSSNNLVLIDGTDHSGRSFIAKYIHNNSKRSHNNFITYHFQKKDSNSKDFFENNNEKSFKKYIDFAKNGTLFLKNIENASFKMQKEILELIKKNFILSNGNLSQGNNPNVRIIASINLSSKDCLMNKELLLQLKQIHIKTSSLKERKEDINSFIEYFVNKKASEEKTFSRKALDLLNQYHWPNNIKELKKEIDSILLLSKNISIIVEEHISKKIKNEQNLSYEKLTLKEAIQDLEKSTLIYWLKKTNGNKTKVAKALKISRTSVVGKVKEYKITKKEKEKENLIISKKTS